MVVVGCVVAVGVVSGFLARSLARRWPAATTAPALSTPTVADEVHRHPRLGAALRRRRDPAALTGLALTVAATVAILGGVGVGVLFAMARSNRGLARADSWFTRFGAEHGTDGSTRILKLLTNFGGTGGVIVLAVLAAVVAVRHTPRRARSIVGFLVVAVAGQFALSNTIKAIVDRARPDLRPLVGFSGTSFPSGHATAAAATLMAIALVTGRGRSWRAKADLTGVAVGLAVVVASTRVLLGVHWFTDVLAGLLLGWGWFALCSIAFGGRLLRFGEPALEGELVAERDAVRHEVGTP